MQIRIKHGIVHMAIAEREHELLDEHIVLNTKYNKYKVDNFVNNLLNKTKAKEEITFNKIKDYMGWAVEEDNVWEYVRSSSSWVVFRGGPVFLC